VRVCVFNSVGLMCYSVAEAKFLSVECHLDDMMVAYPCSVGELGDVWEMVVDHSKSIQVSPYPYPYPWGWFFLVFLTSKSEI